MSLVCHECQQDMQPSDELPGREGGMLTPILPSIVWVAEKATGRNEEEKWVLAPVVTDYKIALCFGCMLQKISKVRLPFLNTLLLAYDAEVRHHRQAVKIEGIFLAYKSCAATTERQLKEAFRVQLKKIPDGCMMCGFEIKGANRIPSFAFRVMDRVKCEQRLSCFGSYQWSYPDTGESGCKICFDCLKTHFPKIFEQMSFDFRKIQNPDQKPTFELYVTKDFMDAMSSYVAENPTKSH